MKSDKIRFKILKLLKDYPTHGYNLYLMLSKEGLVNNASELYKILRSFKKNGFILGEILKSPQGPNKTIYSLTEKGLEEYYSLVIESANNFLDLMAEANLTTINKAIQEGMESFDFNLNKLEDKNIYIDSFKLSHRMQYQLTHKLLTSLKKKNQIYLQSEIITEHELLFFKDGFLDIKILDKNLSIKPHMMDIVFAFGRSSKKQFETRVKQLLEILADEGILFLFVRRRENLREPKIFKIFIDDLLKNVPEKHHKKLAQLLPFHFSERNCENALNDDEIKQILLDFFEEVELLTLPAFISIILAKKPKKRLTN